MDMAPRKRPNKLFGKHWALRFAHISAKIDQTRFVGLAIPFTLRWFGPNIWNFTPCDSIIAVVAIFNCNFNNWLWLLSALKHFSIFCFHGTMEHASPWKLATECISCLSCSTFSTFVVAYCSSKSTCQTDMSRCIDLESDRTVPSQ